MLKASGLWPQTSGVEERGQTSAWQVASTLELPDDCGQQKPSPGVVCKPELGIRSRWQCRL